MRTTLAGLLFLATFLTLIGACGRETPSGGGGVGGGGSAASCAGHSNDDCQRDPKCELVDSGLPEPRPLGLPDCQRFDQAECAAAIGCAWTSTGCVEGPTAPERPLYICQEKQR